MNFRKYIPSSLKSFIRFLYYKQERERRFSNFLVRKKQDKAIAKLDLQARKLIVFIVPGLIWETGIEPINGGVMSVVSLCDETIKLKEIHNAEVILCTHSSDGLLLKFKNFNNSIPVFRIGQLICFDKAEQVMIHVPEYMIATFWSTLQARENSWLQQRDVHYNILNQSIQLMPPLKVIRQLESGRNKVTITTAHARYCNPYYREYYKVALHKFSTWVSPEQYYFKNISEKDNLMVVSPDPHAEKEHVLHRLRQVQGLTVIIIENLSYEQYKQLIARAKWTLTFGEGLDGYLVEPIFSGAVGFAVYNDDFFTNDFANWQTLYKSTEELSNRIVSDICKLDPAENFIPYQQQQFALCAKYYSKKEYKANIASFYRKEYTYA